MKHSPPPAEAKRHRWRVGAWAGAWGALVAGLMALVLDHAHTPAPAPPGSPTWPSDVTLAPAPPGSPTWPSDVTLTRDGERHTLVMVVHPRCPCTLASLDELSRILTLVGDRVRAYVLFVQPEGTGGREWTRSEQWEKAAEIQGLEVVLDAGGALARKLGTTTSGDALLFDASGRLQFHGGVTPARAHRGDSLGRDAILRQVMEGEPGAERSPVYGCTLLDGASPGGARSVWSRLQAWLP